MWMEDALGEESVIKDDAIHSNRALSEGMITIAGNADGSINAMCYDIGRQMVKVLVFGKTMLTIMDISPPPSCLTIV